MNFSWIGHLWAHIRFYGYYSSKFENFFGLIWIWTTWFALHQFILQISGKPTVIPILAQRPFLEFGKPTVNPILAQRPYLIQYWRSSCKMEITLGVYRSAKTFYVAHFSSWYICSCMQILWGIWDGSRERWLQVRSQLHLWSLHLQMRVSLQVPDFSRDDHRRRWSSRIYVLHMCCSYISMKLLITENKVAMVSW